MRRRPLDALSRAKVEAQAAMADALKREILRMDARLSSATPLMRRVLEDEIQKREAKLRQLTRGRY